MSKELEKELLEYDDEKDIFNAKPNLFDHNHDYLIKKYNDYGAIITWYDHKGIEKLHLCVNYNLPEKPIWISSFFNNITKKGLRKVIYSDRTEYFWNEQFVGYEHNFQEYLEKINKLIISNRIFDGLQQLVHNTIPKSSIIVVNKACFKKYCFD